MKMRTNVKAGRSTTNHTETLLTKSKGPRVVTKILAFTMLMCGLCIVGAEAQTGLQPVQALAAYDSTGRRIGALVGFSATSLPGLPNVAFFKENITVVLGVEKNRIMGSWGVLSFTTTDCTGTAYFEILSGFPLQPLTPSAVRNGEVYVPNTSASSLPAVTVRSFFADYLEPGCQVIEVEQDLMPAKVLGSLSFAPPFSVR